MWQARACYRCPVLVSVNNLKHNAAVNPPVNPPTGSQMGLAYMRKSQFRSVQLTSRLRTDGVKSRFLSETPDPASTRQGEYCTVHLGKKTLKLWNPGKSLLVLPVMILLLYVPVTTVQLKEQKHIEIQRVLNVPPSSKEKMKDLFLADLF